MSDLKIIIIISYINNINIDLKSNIQCIYIYEFSGLKMLYTIITVYNIVISNIIIHSNSPTIKLVITSSYAMIIKVTTITNLGPTVLVGLVHIQLYCICKCPTFHGRFAPLFRHCT